MRPTLPVIRFVHLGPDTVYFSPRGVRAWNMTTHEDASTPPGIYAGVMNPKTDEELQALWQQSGVADA